MDAEWWRCICPLCARSTHTENVVYGRRFKIRSQPCKKITNTCAILLKKKCLPVRATSFKCARPEPAPMSTCLYTGTLLIKT